jgi:nicotinamide-nucleotide amidase
MVAWLANYREQNGVSTAVLGISGGVDSAVTAAALKRAEWRVLGYALPIHQDVTETERGREAAAALDLEFRVKDLSRSYDFLVEDFGEFDTTLITDSMKDDEWVKIRKGNIRARTRMQFLYNMAHANNGLVASTDNLSELQAGFWTLHGDVGDISPIQSFNKSWEVPMMAKLLGVPENTWRAKPTDGLGISGGDEVQLGCSYLEWDLMIQAMAALSLSNEANSKTSKDFIMTGCRFNGDSRAEQVFEAVYSRTRRTWFKRMNPVNFEHPRLKSLQTMERMDRMFFVPEGV